MNRNHKIILFGAPLFALILVAIRVYYSLVIWTYQGPDVTFDVLAGDNFGKINTELSKAGFLSSPKLFYRYCQLKGVVNKFKTGRYLIHHDSNMLGIYKSLIEEKSLALLFTVPEGKSLFDIGHMLEDKKIVSYKDFVDAAKDPEILKEEGIKADSAEGYLYPETYDLIPNITAKKIVKMMIQLFHKKTAQLDFSKTHLTKEEAIILASVVEKETGDKKERPMIAGVFYNRLKLKMRLQSDPTTIYGMFENYKGKLTKKDLQEPTEYNTYTVAALPKGPICNPGAAAIEAILNPAKHKFLYFVSQNDGTHIFSENYEDHQKAVNTWQKNPKNREGRSWRNHTN